MEENLLLAIILTTFAGLSTVLGGLLTLKINRASSSVMGMALALAAGVMVYVSFAEMLPEGSKLLDAMFTGYGALMAFHFLMLGAALIYLMDFSKLSAKHSHEAVDADGKLLRSGLIIAFSITLHNFPEGMATFAATLADTKLGIVNAFAIAIHNIPEGLAVALPILKATGSYKKAVGFAFLSGLSEPIGALIGYSFLSAYLNELVIGAILCIISGIMVYVSIVQLLPMARRFSHPKGIALSCVSGMFIMGLSIALMN
jgi:ZIP family zinc transporter